MLLVSLGIPYKISIPTVAIMYASVSMISLVGLPIFLIVVRLITSITISLMTFQTATTPQWFFIELYFSSSKST